jgi:hypothetical protein
MLARQLAQLRRWESVRIMVKFDAEMSAIEEDVPEAPKMSRRREQQKRSLAWAQSDDNDGLRHFLRYFGLRIPHQRSNTFDTRLPARRVRMRRRF